MDLHLTGSEQSRELVGEIAAYSRDFAQAFRSEVSQLHRVVADRTRRVAIGAHAEEILFADLEHIRDLGENLCDLVILHRHASEMSQFRVNRIGARCTRLRRSFYNLSTLGIFP